MPLAGDIIYATDVDICLCQLVQQTGAAQTGWTSATPTAVTFGVGSETVDTHNAHDTGSNTSRINIGVKLGWWHIEGVYVPVNQNNTTLIRAIVGLNGNLIPGSFTGLPFTSPGTSLIGITTRAILVEATSASDYVELYGYQTAGSGSIGTAVNSYAASSLSAIWQRSS